MSTLPLDGIRVIEFTHMVMGPAIGVILADLGAEVTKIEPLQGDNTRRLKGSGAGYFSMYNRNKRSLCVDLKSEQGAGLVRSLAAKADVLIENFRPGAMDKLGFGYEALSALNERLIYCCAKGFLSGPYEHRTAWAVYDIFSCQDSEKVFVGIVSDTQWVKFCDAFEFDDFAADAELATNNGRVAARERILPVVQHRFAGMGKQALMDKLESTGLPFAPIARPHDLFQDPHLNAAGGLLDVELPDGTFARLPALPLEFSGERMGLRRSVPVQGQGGDEVLAELGLDAAEVSALREAGVIR